MKGMSFSLYLRWGILCITVATATSMGLHTLRVGDDARDPDAPPLPTPIRAKMVDGQTRLFISAEDLAASGIQIETLRSTSYQERLSTLSTIIPRQVLAEQNRAYQVAVADVVHTTLSKRAAYREVERLLPLHSDDRIVSDKVLEEAQNRHLGEEANLTVAITQRELQEATIAEEWGPVIGAWIKGRTVEFGRLLSGRQFLVEIALPSDRHADASASIALQPDHGTPLVAQFISGVPHGNPRFQGGSLYAVVSADSRLRSGMTFPASVSLGVPVTGVLVTDSAVVRWQGHAWVFVRLADGAFVRQAVALDVATPNGWLVTTGLSTEWPIVTQGAQLLLSEEIKSTPLGGS